MQCLLDKNGQIQIDTAQKRKLSGNASRFHIHRNAYSITILIDSSQETEWKKRLTVKMLEVRY